MDVNLDLYKIFCMVAREKSLSNAAKKLFVSQSAVSQSIKQLENQLETKLFNRKSRGVELTAEGKLLFEYADGAYTLLENAELKFREMKNLKFGNIRIGASDTVCAILLTEVLKEYHLKFPDISIQLFDHTTNALLNELRHGEIDIAFVNLPVDEEGLNVCPIASINDCFVVSGKYSHLARHTVSVNQLCLYPILMLDENSSSRQFIDSFLSKFGIKLHPCVELGSIDLLLDFAKIGIGVSAVIEQYAKKEIMSGELQKLHLAEPIPQRKIGLVTLKNVSLSPSAQKLIEMVSEQQGEMNLKEK